MNLNRVQFAGRLGKDPVFRNMQNGGKVASLSIASSEQWRDKQTGEKREKTEWANVTVFNEHLVKFAEKWLVKGNRVYVEGKFQTRKWQDQNGNDRYSTEIVLSGFDGKIIPIDWPEKDTTERQADQNHEQSQSGQSLGDEPDSEIPF